jgi:hypothetical protein
MTARVAWIAVVAQLATTVVHAEPNRVEAEAEDRALAHLDRGVAAFRAGDFAEARVEIALAQRLAPDRPNPYRWLAMTEVELGDCHSALIDIESFLSRVPAGDPRVAEVIALRGRCVATGKLRVDSAPSGAAIHIDGGRPIATTPTQAVPIAAGTHRITVAKPGYVALEQPLEVRPVGVTYAHYALIAARADRPIHRRWWFWAALGAVAVTAAGVTYALTRDREGRLPLVTCDAGGCHP